MITRNRTMDAAAKRRIRQRGFVHMNRLLTGLFASVLALSATAAYAQGNPPLKIGGILDMSSLYADITGQGSLEAAKMAAQDFGGEVLGRKIEVIAADHLNKADLAAKILRGHLCRFQAARAGNIGIEARHIEDAADLERSLGLALRHRGRSA